MRSGLHLGINLPALSPSPSPRGIAVEYLCSIPRDRVLEPRPPRRFRDGSGTADRESESSEITEREREREREICSRSEAESRSNILQYIISHHLSFFAAEWGG